MENKQIWKQNLEYAKVIEDILNKDAPYSYESLEDLLRNIVIYLRNTGYKLEKYSSFLEACSELFKKMP